MRRVFLVAVAIALVPFGAHADFEGVIESKMAVQGAKVGGGGNAKTYLSKLGTRMEMEMGAAGQGGMKMTTVILKSRPGIAFLVNDARRTYSEIDTRKSGEGASKGEPEKYTVKRLGSGRIAGYDCVHVSVTSDKGDEYEIWSTKELGSGAEYWEGQRNAARDRSGLLKALREGGAEGWPMKSLVRTKGQDTTVSWEVTKVERRAVPASLFDLSAYRKSEGMGFAAPMGQVQMTPEQQRQLDETMKKMTPEQRKQFEEMMKSMKGAASEAPKRN